MTDSSTLLLTPSKAHGKKWKHLFLCVFGVIVSVGLFVATRSSGSFEHHLEVGKPQEVLQQQSLLSQCTVHFAKQPLTHFSETKSKHHAQKTYQQRYFVCMNEWRRSSSGNKNGPIFFYVGNEADVELYLNHTGLMWENAKEFGAMLVFAEHRYFGKSVVNEFLPSSDGVAAGKKRDMSYLSSEEALADYAVLINQIKLDYNTTSSPVIGFGGSYGGMLGSWFRMKYPHIIDGVVAASAPILSFLGETPPMNPNAFSQVVTFDASVKAGSAPYCVSNIRSSWPHMFAYSKTVIGRAKLTKIFRLCAELTSEEEAIGMIGWVQGAFPSLAMGNFPYPSSYIMNGISTLPAFPMRAACEHIGNKKSYESVDKQLEALRDSISVFYNTSAPGSSGKKCYDLFSPNPESQESEDYWGYLYCTEMCQPFSMDGKNDMFWDAPMNWTSTTESCMNQWGVRPRLYWANTFYGGRKALYTASNIVFSNGNYDPWSGFGVLARKGEKLPKSIVLVNIDQGAHHLDLMFSNPNDPESVKNARNIEKKNMWKWVNEVYDSIA